MDQRTWFGCWFDICLSAPTQARINAGLILRYLLEKCQNVSEAISCLYQLPIASAQTLILADTSGSVALVECNSERIQTTMSLSNHHSFVCATNKFHLTEMIGYNSSDIDDWLAETRFQTMFSACRGNETLVGHLRKSCYPAIMVFSVNMIGAPERIRYGP